MKRAKNVKMERNARCTTGKKRQNGGRTNRKETQIDGKAKMDAKGQRGETRTRRGKRKMGEGRTWTTGKFSLAYSSENSH